MHEISALNEAVKVAERVAKENNVDKIKILTLEVGELTGFLPVFFEKYFSMLVEENPLFSECELVIDNVRGEALCDECHALYNVMKNEGRCPKCGSRSKTILGGQDFKVKNIGF
ncbi:MAG: hydrogenase maturation nickel metallochaperone HypA [Clostridia bacterium]|nr:hydrogenase maturation nickel metallochaperone HypA [Clostridia bacterium]